MQEVLDARGIKNGEYGCVKNGEYGCVKKGKVLCSC